MLKASKVLKFGPYLQVAIQIFARVENVPAAP